MDMPHTPVIVEVIQMLVILVTVLFTPVLITALVLRYRRTRAEMRYRFLAKLVEAGVALPPTLPGEPTAQQCDRRRAIVLLAGGVGLSATLVSLPLSYQVGRPLAELWGLGILPASLGLGYLGNWYLSRRSARRG